MFVMLSHLFIAALCSPAGKGLTSGISLVMFNCVFVSFPCGILGQAGVVLDCIDSRSLPPFLLSRYPQSQLQQSFGPR